MKRRKYDIEMDEPYQAAADRRSGGQRVGGGHSVSPDTASWEVA